ncbi:MAG: cobalamin-dependent protein [Desulfobacteraceae bacterium]|jgi:methanogenic corrinoid protein MtbC1
MISDTVYKAYLNHLLQGKRIECTRIVQNFLDQRIPIKVLYTDLFQKSLYRVGELWEFNRITVAKEHLATAITEGLLNLTYPMLFESERGNQRKKVIISCSANEYHQIGGKMVADICEFNGWDTHFLGANTPVDHMLEHIQEIKPDLVGLSLSVYFNMACLKKELEAIRSNFTHLDILVGGQAFRWGGIDEIKKYAGIEYIPSIDELEKSIGIF